MRLLMRLYPAAWRRRYEEEFLALLEERPLSPFDVVDIALGALDARLRPGDLAIEFAARRSHPMNARLAGWAAVAGGILFTVSMGLGTLLPHPQNEIGGPIFSFAAIALLVALVGLSAVHGRRRPVLAWAAVALPVAGALVSLVGMFGMAVRGDAPIVADLAGWHLWSAGLVGVTVGSILFAVATLIVGVFSRAGATALLVGAAILPLAVMGAVAEAIGVVGIGLFGAGWVWLGYAAVTRRAIASAASPA